MRYLSIIFICLLLGLTACGSNEEDTGELEGANNTQAKPSVMANTPSDMTPTSDNSVSSAANGHLAYIQNETLYVHDLATQQSTEIAPNIFSNFLDASADQKQVYYSVLDTVDRQISVYQYTFSDETNQPIATFASAVSSEAIWILTDWSPNEEWVVIQSFQFRTGPMLASLTGATEQIVIANSIDGVWWTEDNQLVYLIQSDDTPPDDIPPNEYFAPVETVGLINPITSEITDITADIATDDVANEEDIVAALTTSGYSIIIDEQASSFNVIAPDERFGATGQGQYCWKYQIEDTGNIVYTGEDVYSIGNEEALADESIVFLQVEFAECAFLNGPTGKLITLSEGNEPRVITDRLMSMLDRNRVFPFFIRSRYSFSPQQNYVVFVAIDESGTTNSLKMMDMQGGEAVPVLLDDQPLENISAVVWGH